MDQWYVVHTQVGKELLAKEQLERQGFNSYLPRFYKQRHHARKVDQVLVPLFPRYMFVAFDVEVNQWRCINGTRGVAYLITNGNKPTRVLSRFIDSLKINEIEQEIIGELEIDSFKTGDKLRVLEGVFAGYEGIFTKLTDSQRISILMEFMGREMQISLPKSAVEAA